MQNQPDPSVPVGERRWLDRLRAAWDDVRRKPGDEPSRAKLEAVAAERPEEARYRFGTFAADAVKRARGRSAPPRGTSTPDTDRFDDEAGR